MGLGEQGKGAFISREQRRSVQLLRGTSKQRKCWGEHGTQENKLSIFGEQASLFQPPPPTEGLDG